VEDGIDEDHPAGRVNCVGSRGKGRGGSLTLAGSAAAHYLSFPFTCTPFVKGLISAHSDGGFLLSGFARRGGSRFLLFGLGYCTGAVYILVCLFRSREKAVHP